LSLRHHALDLLARREHSRAELGRKLARFLEEGDDPAQLDELLDDLEREGLLSNARYAETLAHARHGRHGSLRLKADLRGKGVPEAEMATVLEDARASDLEAARAVWMKKFGTAPRDANERAKQMRFLAGRGFPPEVIRKVMGGGED
jgi:regulatory protein